MNFKDLLKKYVTEDEKVNEFLTAMKENKIFLASEENLDTRYSKLKEQSEAKDAEHQEALNLIEELKQANVGSEELQTKIAEYEETINTLKAEKVELAKDNALKMMLLSNKAKANDIDYLMFKAKNGEMDIKFDKDGNLTNAEELVEGMKKIYPNNFEASAKKKVDVNILPDDEGDKETITKEQFAKMNYMQRVELLNNDPDVYAELTGNKE